MKKWLILFITIDFMFVALVLKLSNENQRSVAAYDDPFYNELTDGQKVKYDFVKSLHFSIDSENLILETDRLQALCLGASLVQIKFAASAVAYAGVHPTISHTYSCEGIKKDLSTSSLKTSIKNFLEIQKLKKISLVASEMTSTQIFVDEEFPVEWVLSELSVSGTESNFTVTSAELEKVHAEHPFEFNLTTFLK